jgi:hypothetical protein
VRGPPLAHLGDLTLLDSLQLPCPQAPPKACLHGVRRPERGGGGLLQSGEEAAGGLSHKRQFAGGRTVFRALRCPGADRAGVRRGAEMGRAKPPSAGYASRSSTSVTRTIARTCVVPSMRWSNAGTRWSRALRLDNRRLPGAVQQHLAYPLQKDRKAPETAGMASGSHLAVPLRET